MNNVNEHKAGYKNTQLGWIPQEWNIRRLGSLCKKLNVGFVGVCEPFYTNRNDGVPLIRTGNMQNDKLLLDDLKFVTDDFHNKNKKSIVVSGDILIARHGNSGNAVLVPSDIVEANTLNIVVLRVNPELLQNRFAAYAINSEKVISQVLSKSAGSTQGVINTKEIAKLYIPVPKIDEQIEIAAILFIWDEAITKTQHLIAQLQQRNKGLMQQLLTEKNNWKEYRIGELLKEVKRPVKWNDEELYHLISVRRRSGGAFFREGLYGKQILTKQLFTAEEGDFLISKMQIVHGASAVVPKGLAGMKISGSYIVVHAKDEKVMDINFFNWLSKTRWFYRLTYVSSYGVHIEKMTFDFDDFKRRKIMLPPSVEEQKRIVKILSAGSEEAKLYEQKLAALQHQKKGLMQKLLTGEIRVKIDNN